MAYNVSMLSSNAANAAGVMKSACSSNWTHPAGASTGFRRARKTMCFCPLSAIAASSGKDFPSNNAFIRALSALLNGIHSPLTMKWL